MTLTESDQTSRHSYKTWVAIFLVWLTCALAIPAALMGLLWLASLFSSTAFHVVLLIWCLGVPVAVMWRIDDLYDVMDAIECGTSAICARLWGH